MSAEALSGADLDFAVAQAGKEWESAHVYFPTMTLDPTFRGARVIELHDRRVCILEPRNRMRQDPQEYSPSTDWRFGGPIIERERITVSWDDIKERFYADLEHAARGDGVQRSYGVGPTYLIAAMRAFVAAKATGEAQ